MSDNLKTIIYAAVMCLIVAGGLSTLYQVMKPMHIANRILDKKQSILKAVKFEEGMDVDAEFEKRITPVATNSKGEINKEVDAFDVNIREESRKSVEDRVLPLYLYKQDDGKVITIVPLLGLGLWDEISGFVAMSEGAENVVGAVFSHVGETAGLGAEITTDWFQDQFKGEKMFNADGEYSFQVMKGKGNAEAVTNPYKVDGISGATITARGVDAMIADGMNNYSSYFKK